MTGTDRFPDEVALSGYLSDIPILVCPTASVAGSVFVGAFGHVVSRCPTVKVINSSSPLEETVRCHRREGNSIGMN